MFRFFTNLFRSPPPPANLTPPAGDMLPPLEWPGQEEGVLSPTAVRINREQSQGRLVFPVPASYFEAREVCLKVHQKLWGELKGEGVPDYDTDVSVALAALEVRCRQIKARSYSIDCNDFGEKGRAYSVYVEMGPSRFFTAEGDTLTEAVCEAILKS
jgi:hypothetical protein